MEIFITSWNVKVISGIDARVSPPWCQTLWQASLWLCPPPSQRRLSSGSSGCRRWSGQPSTSERTLIFFDHPELVLLHLYQSFLLICHQKVESGIGNHLVPIVLNMIGLGFVRAESIFHLIQVFRWRPAGATSPFFLTHFRPWDQVLKMVFYKITMVNRGGDSRTPGCTKSGHLPLLKEEKRAILCPFIYMHLRNFAAKMALAIWNEIC